MGCDGDGAWQKKGWLQKGSLSQTNFSDAYFRESLGFSTVHTIVNFKLSNRHAKQPRGLQKANIQSKDKLKSLYVVKGQGWDDGLRAQLSKSWQQHSDTVGPESLKSGRLLRTALTNLIDSRSRECAREGPPDLEDRRPQYLRVHLWFFEFLITVYSRRRRLHGLLTTPINRPEIEEPTIKINHSTVAQT